MREPADEALLSRLLKANRLAHFRRQKKKSSMPRKEKEELHDPCDDGDMVVLAWIVCVCVAGVTSLEMSCSELETGKIPSSLISHTHFVVCCQCEMFRCLASVSLAVLTGSSVVK